MNIEFMKSQKNFVYLYWRINSNFTSAARNNYFIRPTFFQYVGSSHNFNYMMCAYKLTDRICYHRPLYLGYMWLKAELFTTAYLHHVKAKLKRINVCQFRGINFWMLLNDVLDISNLYVGEINLESFQKQQFNVCENLHCEK